MFKEDFPILSRKINDFPLIYLDNAATTQKPRAMIDKMQQYLENSNANIHRGIYSLTEESTHLFEDTRKKIAECLSELFIDNVSADQLIFTKNTTECINLVANSLIPFIQKGETILISSLEHHSNMLPWRKIAFGKGFNIEWMEFDDFSISTNILESHLSSNSNIKFVAVTGCSNVTGAITNVNKIIEICQKYGVKVLIDGAQWVPHIIWEENKYLLPDFLVFSAHKMLGPTGVGVLYVKNPSLLNNPYMVGGNTVTKVSKTEINYKTGFELYEAGTQDINSVIGFNESIKYILEKRKNKISEHLTSLTTQLYETLSNITELKLYSPSSFKPRIPLFSFSIKNIHPHDISDFLDKSGICVRSGQHCTGVLHDEMKINATTRVSAYIYNDKNDIIMFGEEIKKCIKFYS